MAASSLQMMVRIGGTIWLFQAYDHELRTDMFLCFFFFHGRLQQKDLESAKAHNAVLLCQQICSAQYFGTLRGLGSFWTGGLPPFGEGSSGIFDLPSS